MVGRWEAQTLPIETQQLAPHRKRRTLAAQGVAVPACRQWGTKALGQGPVQPGPAAQSGVTVSEETIWGDEASTVCPLCGLSPPALPALTATPGRPPMSPKARAPFQVERRTQSNRNNKIWLHPT